MLDICDSMLSKKAQGVVRRDPLFPQVSTELVPCGVLAEKEDAPLPHLLDRMSSLSLSTACFLVAIEKFCESGFGDRSAHGMEMSIDFEFNGDLAVEFSTGIASIEACAQQTDLAFRQR